VDASSQFLSGADGNRLINVAISRAKAHIIIPYHQDDLQHPALAKIHSISSKLWQTKGDYSRPFTFARAA
jgi:superfamily I DNA and/or RNA helicase